MKIGIKLNKLAAALVFTFVLLLGAISVSAQADLAPAKRLKNGVKVIGNIGGEAHDGYVIRARKGKTMTVQISWTQVDDNRAEFTVSKSADFFGGEPVNFGKTSDKGKRWTGKIPKTRDYYFYVVAHPSADYTIKVSLK